MRLDYDRTRELERDIFGVTFTTDEQPPRRSARWPSALLVVLVLGCGLIPWMTDGGSDPDRKEPRIGQSTDGKGAPGPPGPPAEQIGDAIDDYCAVYDCRRKGRDDG